MTLDPRQARSAILAVATVFVVAVGAALSPAGSWPVPTLALVALAGALVFTASWLIERTVPAVVVSLAVVTVVVVPSIAPPALVALAVVALVAEKARTR